MWGAQTPRRFPRSLPSLGVGPGPWSRKRLHAPPVQKWSASVCGGGVAGKHAGPLEWARRTPTIGPVLLLTGGGGRGFPVWIISVQRSRRAAAPYILGCGVSARTKALRWAIKLSSIRCRACEVSATCALPRASVCSTRRVARTKMALAACRCASAIPLACAVVCCKISRLPRTKACNRPGPPIAAIRRPLHPFLAVCGYFCGFPKMFVLHVWAPVCPRVVYAVIEGSPLCSVVA